MQPPSKFRDWASMARLPNVPTVWSNVLTAWMLANGGITYVLANGKHTMIREPGPLVVAVIGGTLLYAAGTLLSELCDEKFDRQYRPERPIPAGRVSRKMVAWICAVSMVTGNLALIGASVRVLVLNLNGNKVDWAYGTRDLTGAIGIALVLAIIGYALLHKRSGWLAAILMALCRVLLGLAVVFAAQGMWWDTVPWMIALGMNIAGISWLARGESRPVPGGIAGAILLIAVVPAAIAFFFHSLWNYEDDLWLALVLWGLAVWWLTQPLRVRVDGLARGKTVGRALAALPILDALFLIPVCGSKWALVPLGCMAAALILRRIASPT